MDRDFQFKIRLSTEEAAWLEELAEGAGVTKTDFLRLLLRRERARLAATPNAKRASTPRRQKPGAKE